MKKKLENIEVSIANESHIKYIDDINDAILARTYAQNILEQRKIKIKKIRSS